MGRRTLALALMWSLLLAGCGGSKKATNSAAPGSTATTTPATTPTTATTTTPTTTATTPPATPTTGTATTGSTTTGTQTSTSTPGPVQADVVPATFVVKPGGVLSPQTVSAVTSIPIELTVVSGDGKAHKALLSSPRPHSLSVPAGGRASVLLTGLLRGRYRISVDGFDRGTLVVGFTPGP
jgi:hypothetical protein